jgi:hypothetical protein
MSAIRDRAGEQGRSAVTDAAPRLLARLRSRPAMPAGAPDFAAEWQRSDVRFAASAPPREAQWDRAGREVCACIKPVAGVDAPILHEGGVYDGCWLESTGTINAELLARFMPDIAQRTFAAFAAQQRADGLLPYKLTPKGPGFAQIQIVTPLARSVWTHYGLSGDRAFLRTMYDAMARNDSWLAQYRDTRGTGAVEAFCTYDTGHDLSARFWHVPDSPAGNDPAAYDRNNPLLPLIAPDLTANVACQRLYLARIAEAMTATATGAWCGCSPTCSCACSRARSATAISSRAPCVATSSTRASSLRAIPSPPSRSMTRGSTRHSPTIPGRAPPISSASSARRTPSKRTTGTPS